MVSGRAVSPTTMPSSPKPRQYRGLRLTVFGRHRPHSDRRVAFAPARGHRERQEAADEIGATWTPSAMVEAGLIGCGVAESGRRWWRHEQATQAREGLTHHHQTGCNSSPPDRRRAARLMSHGASQFSLLLRLVGSEYADWRLAPQVGLEPIRLRFASHASTGCEATARPRRSSPNCVRAKTGNPPVNRRNKRR